MEFFTRLVNQFWSVSQELSPWFLLGTVLAGIITVVLPKTILKRQMSGFKGVLAAVSVGVPLPLCSCAVIPTGIGLRRAGASEGASVGFLVSTPQTGLDSILVTAAFLGWTFAFYKVAIALILGTIGGWILVAIANRQKQALDRQTTETKSTQKSLPVLQVVSSDPNETKTADQPDVDKGEESCCHSGGESEANTKSWLAVFARSSLEVVRSIYLWLLIGILLSALISTLLTPTSSQWISEQPVWVQTLAILGISTPLYVCTTASVPIAAALVSKGVSVGATLVFLMAGPATNLATLGAVWKSFSRTAFWVYLGITVFGSVIAAIAFDSLFGFQLQKSNEHLHDHGNWVSSVSAAILLVSCTVLLVQDIRQGKLISRLRLS